jgi:hypothetical protein
MALSVAVVGQHVVEETEHLLTAFVLAGVDMHVADQEDPAGSAAGDFPDQLARRVGTRGDQVGCGYLDEVARR